MNDLEDVCVLVCLQVSICDVLQRKKKKKMLIWNELKLKKFLLLLLLSE